MKVLIINGSPRLNGNTSIAINELTKTLKENGIEVEIISIGNEVIRGCIACGNCYKTHKCIFNDIVNRVAEKFEEVNGLVVATPVYYASANGTVISFLDRLFYSTHFDKRFKVGASIAVCRRGGASATFDEINKYFTIAQMPVVSSQYWNSVHGRKVGEAVKDLEGLQTMRTLGKNIAFLIKAIQLGINTYGLPDEENKVMTNFIDESE